MPEGRLQRTREAYIEVEFKGKRITVGDPPYGTVLGMVPGRMVQQEVTWCTRCGDYKVDPIDGAKSWHAQHRCKPA